MQSPDAHLVPADAQPVSKSKMPPVSPEFVFQDHLHCQGTTSPLGTLANAHMKLLRISLHTWPGPVYCDAVGAHQNQLLIALWRPIVPAPTLFMFCDHVRSATLQYIMY